MGDTADRVIAIATAEVGYREGYSNGEWNNDQKYSDETPGLEWSDRMAWCATFADGWVPMKAGVSHLFPRTASCSEGRRWYIARGQYSEYPAIGAQIFFGRSTDTYGRGGSHTGLVRGYDDTYVYTVEGNTNDSGSANGNGVYLRKRARRDAYIDGYGYPAYPDGIVSADPKHGGVTTPKPPTPPAPAFVPFPGAAFFTAGRRSPIIASMHKRLVAVGCSRYKSSTDTDVWGSGDVASYAAWQRKCGYSGSDADGKPGASSWAALKVPTP